MWDVTELISDFMCTITAIFQKCLYTLVLSLRTDFFVDMSDQISSWWRQLSTKQCSGNKCSDILTKIQTSNYAMDHLDWTVNSGGLSVKQLHSLDSALFANSQAFLKAHFIFFFFMYLFVFKIVHYYVNKTESLLFCCQFCPQSVCRRQHYYSGGSRGAQQARAPPKIGSTVIFITHFVSECLKIGLS